MQPGDIPLHHFPFRHADDVPLMVKPFNPNEPWTESAPDRHSFYAIFWIYEGGGAHHIDYTDYEVKPCSLFLMRPGQAHFFDVDRLPAGTSIFFLEEFLYLDNQFELTELFYLLDRSPALYPSPEQSHEITQLINQLLKEYERERLGYHDALRHLMQLLLIHIRRAYQDPHNVPVQSTPTTRISSHFQRLVDEHFLNDHLLQSYADRLGITTGHLNEQVKQGLGVSASQVIRRRITIEAKRLLAHTEMSVSQLSAHVGFKDSSYFSRFFRRESGLSPVSYRRAYRDKYRITR